MSYVLTKDFVVCVMAQSIPSVPIPPGKRRQVKRPTQIALSRW